MGGGDGRVWAQSVGSGDGMWGRVMGRCGPR